MNTSPRGAARFRRFEEDALKSVKSGGKPELFHAPPFRPYIYLETSLSIPSSITTVCFTGIARWKHIQMSDDLLGLPEDALLETVGPLICKHFLRNEGRCPFFGEITGYTVRLFQYVAVRFNTIGQVLERVVGPWREERVGLSIRGKRVPEGLLMPISPSD